MAIATTSSTTSPQSAEAHGEHHGGTWALTIGAIGVVYGDIGTSPLYAFREAVHVVVPEGQLPTLSDVQGILSLIVWAIMIVVTAKYVGILLRLDNRGEGGTLALMALARSVIYRNTIGFLFLGMAGTALFFGDSIITPAISVLSAVEGMQVVAPHFDAYILPITIGIILGLFMFQSHGTAKVSALFGPVTTTWFGVLGISGIHHIMDNPQVLWALSPTHAVTFLAGHLGIAMATLGAVFLSVTGAEALYADLGHFGRKPIQLAWFWYILPCLILNYMGQGAMVLTDHTTMDNPFFKLVSEHWQIPLVLIATCATIIASQAVITGAFSLTRQAVNLGLLPRMVIKHTSDKHSGQIYLPQVNYTLMIGVIVLVMLFKSSTNLAATYGISVTGAMVVDAIMSFFVLWQIREWSLPLTIGVVGPFLIVDTVFLTCNLSKLASGGWVPLSIAATLMVIMTTWIQGTFIVTSRARKRDLKLDKFIKEYKERYPDIQRVKGSAFFFALDPSHTPSSLTQNVRHNKVLHEKNIILSVKIEPFPYVEPEARALITHLNDDFTVIVLRFGFKDDPDVQQELMRLLRDKESGVDFDWEHASLFISRRALRSHPKYGLPLWQDVLYIWLSKHASEPTDFYKLPVGRVIEIGRQVII
ncbi:MAG: potassium transporter Kup [Alphaproteobacteria bacterium]|nr:potassium transporter Kup [Alphaproteobacteria bacterium]